MVDNVSYLVELATDRNGNHRAVCNAIRSLMGINSVAKIELVSCRFSNGISLSLVSVLKEINVREMGLIVHPQLLDYALQDKWMENMV